MKKCILTLLFILSLVSLNACVYRPTVQQGNILSEADLSAVHRGMTRKAVINAVGDPVLSNIYPDGRMIYIYTVKPNHGKRKRRLLVVTFRSGRVVQTTVESSDS